MARSHTIYRTLAALVLLGVMTVVFASLGNWQLDRAAQREAIKQAIEEGRNSPPLVLTADTQAGELVPWRPALAQGEWLHDMTVIVENRNHEGRPGVWVATPLLLDPASNTAVLVLRGWIPRPLRASETLPPIPTPMGATQISGELLERVPRLFELWTRSDDTMTGPGSSPLLHAQQSTPVVQNLYLNEYAAATGLKLVPAVLAQTEPAPVPAGTDAQDPFTRVWPEPNLDADNNRGYALQWFGFATIAGVAWLVIAWRALRRRMQPPAI